MSDDLPARAAAYTDLIRTRAAASLSPDALRVLEVGCGDGDFLAKIPLSPGRRVFGVDRRDWTLDFERRTRGPSVLADVARLPFRDGAFDAVFCVHTIQVLDAYRARRGLSELVRVTAPAGRVVVTMPNRDHPVLRFRLWLREATYRLRGAVHAFRAADVLRRLSGAGAEPECVEAVVVPPFVGRRGPSGIAADILAHALHVWALRAPRRAPHLIVSAVRRSRRLCTTTRQERRRMTNHGGTEHTEPPQ